MICETRIIPTASNFLISTGPGDGVYWPYMRPIVVRLGSVGQKFITKEGFLRDMREHDSDRAGYEFEIDLVDIENEPARFFTLDKGLLEDLKRAGQGATVAIGWKRVMRPDFSGIREGGTTPTSQLVNVAWEVER